MSEIARNEEKQNDVTAETNNSLQESKEHHQPDFETKNVENKTIEAPSESRCDESSRIETALEVSKETSSPIPLTNSGESNGSAAAPNQTPAEKTVVVEKQQRKRRRRLCFCVMEVLNPTDQNQRSHPAKLANMQLEVGDIILTIQGEETARKSFEDAVKMFASANVVGEDGYIQCVVTVARRKKVAPAPISLPKYIPSLPKNGSSTPLTEVEFRALAKTMVEAARNQNRLLGQQIKRSLMEELFQNYSLLSTRALDFLVSSWEYISDRIKRDTRRKATEHWANKWQSERDEIKSSTKTPLSDAQRSSRRARPRPARGCRCGNPDHEYVNDINCPLYSNLRLLKQESSTSSDDPKAGRLQIKGPKDLNAVEKAFKDRFIRMKEEESALAAEATFVDEMESIQLEQCGMAIFAPGSLAAMVLSGVVEIEPKFRDRKVILAVETKEPENVGKNSMDTSNADDDDDDDDDDIPLTSLGKRHTASNSSSLQHNKKSKIEPTIPLDFIMSLIRYICARWGHVYREPSELDYAWRWEVYHGQFTSTDTTKDWKNPRRAGALSLENLSFLIQDALLNELQEEKEGTLDTLSLATLNSIAFAILPSATGIVDELYALLRSSILELNEAGIPKLSSHWYTHVDVLLLDDMDSYWGIRADPTGKFGMSQKIRSTLHREWERTDEGWILVNEDPYDIVYEFAVFDEWRDAFEDKEQTKADSIEGVGRFGI